MRQIPLRDRIFFGAALVVIGGSHFVLYPEHGLHQLEALFAHNAVPAPLVTCDQATTMIRHDVDYDGQAFVPAELTVEACDILRFTNRSDTPVQPAVGPHPSHEVFPEFDAGRPLEKGETFSLVVNRVGTFSFHDHENPAITGKLLVRERPKPPTGPDPVDAGVDASTATD